MGKVYGAVMTAPKKVNICDVDLPDVGSQEGWLHVAACGVCGSDVKTFNNPSEMPPTILGHEIVGYVEKCGQSVEDRWGVRVGDYVLLEEYLPCGHCKYCRSGHFRWCLETDLSSNAAALRYGSVPFSIWPSLWGGYAQYVYLHSRAVFHSLPTYLSPFEATLSLPLANGIQWVLLDGELQAGQTVLVIGPGQQGLACVYAAHKAGADRIIVIGLPEDSMRLKAAKQLGATDIFTGNAGDLQEQIQLVTAGRGVDIAIDTAAGLSEELILAVNVASKGGRVIVTSGSEIQFFPIKQIQKKAIQFNGVRGHSYNAVETAIKWLMNDNKFSDVLNSKIIPLDRIQHALIQLQTQSTDRPTHVVVDPWLEA